MPRKVIPEIVERNRSICTDWINRISMVDIGHRHGLTDCAIKKIVDQAGLKESDRVGVKPPRLTASRKPRVSPLHVQIGQQVSCYRILKKDLTLTVLAHRLGMSIFRLSALEGGTYDPTLSEVFKIAAELEVPVSQLLASTSVSFKKVEGQNAAHP